MAVSVFFGLPGCGKTTLFTKLALDAVSSKKYPNVFGNVPLKVLGYTYIDNDCIGKYSLENCMLLIDEATLFADSRDFKKFDHGKLTYFLEHRHFFADICLFTQIWDGLDRRIRLITCNVFYVYKPRFILGKWFTRYYRIDYGYIFPNKKETGQRLGEIEEGYGKPYFLVRWFSPWLFRPKYYKYYDSWIRPEGFKPLPAKYHPYVEIDHCTGEVLHSKKERYRAQLRARKKRITTFLMRAVAVRSWTSSLLTGCKNAVSILFSRIKNRGKR